MKAVKLVIKVLVVVVILAVAAVLALPLWFGPVVKTGANAAVPGIVKTGFRIGHLSLNPYTARFELSDLNLSNPTGYMVKDAVRVGEVIFDAETASLMTDVIHVEEIKIRDLFVSVVSGGENNVLNFKQIQYNLAGGKDKYEAAQSVKAAAEAETADNPPKEAKAEKASKKVIIDRLEVSGLTLQLSILPLRIPSVVLTDIGRKTGGTTFEEAWNQILDGVMKSAGMAGDQLKALQTLSGDSLKKANETVSKASAQASKVMGDTTKKLSETTGQATKVAETATKTVSSTLEKTTGVANGTVEATKNAVDSSAKAVEDSAKAVGDGAKKAVDKLKSLW